jgi:hypothetical protein
MALLAARLSVALGLSLTVLSAGPSRASDVPSEHAPARATGRTNPFFLIPMYTRLKVVRSLLNDGRNDEALKECLSLWEYVGEQTPPAGVSIRSSSMKSEMQTLFKVYKPARAAFIAERDRIAAELKTDARTFADLDDWIMLNELVGQTDATLEWFDRIKLDPDAAKTLDREGIHIRSLLVERKRWADVGIVDTDPLRLLRLLHGIMRLPALLGPPERRETRDATMLELLRKEASLIYACQLAAGKERIAIDVLNEAIKLDPSADMRVALVRKALEIGQFRKHMVEQLDAAEKAGSDVKCLREQLLKLWAKSSGS